MSTLPKLRENLELKKTESTYPSTASWVLYDKVQNRFFRLHQKEIEILKCLQLNHTSLRSLVDIKEKVYGLSKIQLSDNEIEQFFEFLSSHSLLEINSNEMRAQCISKKFNMPSWQKRLTKSYFFFKIPLVNPDRHLAKLLPLTQWIFTKKSAFFLGVISILGIFLASREWHQFMGAAAGLLTPQGMSFFLIALAVVKVLHEMGHALAAKSMGCSVNNMGIAFMVFWPILYTDTTDSWRLSSGKQRLWIGVAGIMVELIIAAICLILWQIVPEGNIRNTLFLLATVTWAMTLLINLNPLMRFDGYFVFSDLIGIENLQERAFSLGKWFIRTRLIGMREVAPEKPRKILLTYCYAAWLYRLLLATTITILIYNLFFKVLAIFLIASYLIAAIAKPIGNEIYHWWVHRDKINPHHGMLTFTPLIAGLFIVLVFPWSSSIQVPAIHQTSNKISVYTAADGKITTLSERGQTVSAGDIIMTIDAYDLQHELALVENELLSLRWELQNHSVSEGRTRSFHRLKHELVSVEQKKKSLLAMHSLAETRAEFSGTFTDVPSDIRLGNWVPKGTKVGTLIQKSNTSHVIAYVDERNLARITTEARAEFLSSGVSQGKIAAVVESIEPTTVSRLENLYVASFYGGEVPTNSNQPDEVVGAFYRVHLHSDAPSPQRVLRGTVTIRAERSSMIMRLLNKVLGIWRRESGF